eukprot:TRINITY_DN12156_c0_g1_i1.p1 TRINITY_DN12156_c0_g1~~TRINITY_DN12156_c0_g1_i1.p1  ORF type:complete len:195 (+),score=29.07 TRINITY_DN12156_c0_g1_i1:1-585(+)
MEKVSEDIANVLDTLESKKLERVLPDVKKFLSNAQMAEKLCTENITEHPISQIPGCLLEVGNVMKFVGKTVIALEEEDMLSVITYGSQAISRTRTLAGKCLGYLPLLSFDKNLIEHSDDNSLINCMDYLAKMKLMAKVSFANFMKKRLSELKITLPAYVRMLVRLDEHCSVDELQAVIEMSERDQISRKILLTQ